MHSHERLLVGRDTRVVPSNIILERRSGPPREGKIWGSEPQFAAMPPIAAAAEMKSGDIQTSIGSVYHGLVTPKLI